MPPERRVILVLDDDRPIRELLQELLELEGYAVECATDGAAGLARIEAGGIDLILVDLRLPKLDGLELCRRVRARRDVAQVPIIVLTAVANDVYGYASVAAGADDYLTKPFDLDELLDRVRTQLNRGGGPSP